MMQTAANLDEMIHVMANAAAMTIWAFVSSGMLVIALFECISSLCRYYVFPSASHNRLEHSIGVAHKAQVLLPCRRHYMVPHLGSGHMHHLWAALWSQGVACSIYRTQRNELQMSKEDVVTVELAGAFIRTRPNHLFLIRSQFVLDHIHDQPQDTSS